MGRRKSKISINLGVVNIIVVIGIYTKRPRRSFHFDGSSRPVCAWHSVLGMDWEGQHARPKDEGCIPLSSLDVKSLDGQNSQGK